MAQRSTSNVQKLSNVQHFFDKLLRIKDLLTTTRGISLAGVRHQSMIVFLQDLAQELVDAGSPDGPLLLEALSQEKF